MELANSSSGVHEFDTEASKTFLECPNINRNGGKHDDKIDEDKRRNYSNSGSINHNEKQLRKDKGPPWYRSQRYLLAFMLFGCTMNVFFQRVNISINIVCMVNSTAINELHRHEEMQQQHHHQHQSSPQQRIQRSNNRTDDTENKQTFSLDGNSDVTDNRRVSLAEKNDSYGRNHGDDSCSSFNIQETEAAEDGPFVWDKQTQGLILGASYWSSAASTIPISLLVRNVSPKRAIILGLTIISTTSMLSHGAALLSPWLLFALKIIEGAAHPLIVLSVFGMWVKWGPPDEMTGLIAFSFTGVQFANILVFPLAGLLCKYCGWPSVFYAFGLLGLVWTVLFFILISDTPVTHPRITPQERHYIESSIEGTNINKKPPTPWKSLLTSIPVWAIVCSHFTFHWALFLMLTTLPQYMKEVLKFKIDSNGVYSMMPFVAMFISTLFVGQLANCMIQRKILSLAWIRKLFAVIANLIPAILLCVLGILDSTQSGLAVALLSVSLGILGFHYGSFLANSFDIAPTHAQAIATVSIPIATIPGIITPYLVASITKDKTRAQWQTVFFMTAAVLVAGTLAFCIMARVKIQQWAKLPKEEDNCISL